MSDWHDIDARLGTNRGPSLGDRRATLQARIERAEAELAKLETLPDEPIGTDGTSVVWFQRTFHGGSRKYTYAAVRCSDDGLWYTTGPQSPKGYSWDELMIWLQEGDPGAIIWFATNWERIN
jgi:hypothetical protein